MLKHLGNLKRLHHKLGVALGMNHPHVLQLQAEIESYSAKVSRSASCTSVQRQHEMGRSFNHRWKALTSHPA